HIFKIVVMDMVIVCFVGSTPNDQKHTIACLSLKETMVYRIIGPKKTDPHICSIFSRPIVSGNDDIRKPTMMGRNSFIVEFDKIAGQRRVSILEMQTINNQVLPRHL